MPDQDVVSRLNAALEGRYRIERQLGEGGMATVYLAQDLKHERKVALKVLKPELAAVVGAERFLAEIKTTANLQHPHILPLHDSGNADGFLFYVMPYVEGESLRDRLDREQQLPVNEAVRIAASVAAGLGYAHRHGVIHRDIKPANILLHDGQPVISDFGIALAVRAGGGNRLTETGLSVGTPHYMSPEQATGDQTVGPASDVYALGCVLYEMLVGEPPYTGSNAQAILGKIIQGEAQRVSDIRKSTPANVVATVARSLEKLPADRFATADELAHALDDAGFRWGEPVGAGAAATGGGFWKPLALALGAVAAGLALGLGVSLSRPEEPRPVQRFASPFARGQEPLNFGQPTFTLSRDGSMAVYEGPSEEGQWQLWIRRWDDLEATPLRSSVEVNWPSLSPDGREIVFTQTRTGSLVALPLEGGGPPRTLGEGSAAVWADDGFVYFSSRANVVRVPAAGGIPEVLGVGDAANALFVDDVLPEGAAVLVTASRPLGVRDIQVLEPSSGKLTTIVEDAFDPRYVRTGHLLYVQDGVLWAMPFDVPSREPRGTPVPLLEGVGAYSVSDEGKLLYSTAVPGSGYAGTELVWVSRRGEVEPVEDGWTFDAGEGNPGWALSPDGTRIAMRIATEGHYDMWIKELPTGPLRRLTNSEEREIGPTWTEDGTSVAYFSPGSGGEVPGGVWQVAANFTGAPKLLVATPLGAPQMTISRDVEWLVLRTGALQTSAGQRDLVTFRPGIDSTLVPLVADPDLVEESPALSPDGRWLAYSSDETGRLEIFVRPFPDIGLGKVQVSIAGGVNPLWAHTSPEIYYWDDDNLVAASYEVDAAPDGFRVTNRTTLFRKPDGVVLSPGLNVLSVTPDDQRFLMGRSAGVGPEREDQPELVLVDNFLEELRQRVPVP